MIRATRCPASWAAAAAAAMLIGCSGGGSQPTRIVWDTYGVPHIYAGSDAEVFRAFGYAQMASHGDLVLKLYAEARGRAAEYLGPAYLESDRYVRTMGVPGRADQWLTAQSPAFRANLEAFAEGINQYATEHPDEIGDSVEAVLPVDAADVVAHAHRIVHFVFVHGNERALAAFRQPRAAAPAGSNTWAVAPSRSASGHAMLLANPHLAWSDLFLFYEAHLNGPGYNTYGVSLVGVPVLAIAFNEHLGWSHTVNTYDGSDLYRLSKGEDGYWFDGTVRPFEETREVLRVRQPDGSFADDTLVIRRSVHGPVVLDSADAAFAARVAGLDRPGMMHAWWDMGRATSFEEFETAVKRLDIPMFNIMYADRAGHIYYLFGGDVPVRPRGDWAYWAGVVPGDSTATLWTEYLPYERLPKLLDPSTGWLQNANDPPWSSTVPSLLDPADFPPYVAPLNMAFRPQRSARMLAEDSSVTFDEMVAYKHSTRMELADRLLDDLLPAALASSSPRARRAARVLEQWDRQANADSRGALLFHAWTEALPRGGRGQPFARSWSLDSALTTPDGLRDPAAAVRALDEAAANLERMHGALDVAWGDVMRLRRGALDLPANGAPGDPLGVFRVAYFVPEPDGKHAMRAGDTYYAITEFGDPVRAKVLLAYGNATQRGSPHQTDQLELFARLEMRDAWRLPDDVLAHARRHDTLTYR